MQDPERENTNESDTTHETKEDPGKEGPSRPRPSAEVKNGNAENNPSNSDQVVGDPGDEVLSELNISNTVGDSKKEFANKLNASFEAMEGVEKDSSSDLDSSAVYPEKENLSALDQLLDITKDPEKAYPYELDPSFETTSDFRKDASSKFNPSVETPAKENFSDLESLSETPELPLKRIHPHRIHQPRQALTPTPAKISHNQTTQTIQMTYPCKTTKQTHSNPTTYRLISYIKSKPSYLSAQKRLSSIQSLHRSDTALQTITARPINLRYRRTTPPSQPRPSRLLTSLGQPWP